MEINTETSQEEIVQPSRTQIEAHKSWCEKMNYLVTVIHKEIANKKQKLQRAVA